MGRRNFIRAVNSAAKVPVYPEKKNDIRWLNELLNGQIVKNKRDDFLTLKQMITFSYHEKSILL